MKIQKLAVKLLLGAATPCVLAAPFAYLPSPDTNQVIVYDLATDSARSTTAGKILTTLPVQSQPVAVAPNRAGTFVYVVNKSSNSVTIIDSAVNRVVGTMPTGSKPVAAVTSRNDKKLYVANSGSNSISVFDLEKQQQISTIASGGSPSKLLSSNDGRVYVLCDGSNQIQAYDTNTDQLLFTLDPGTPVAAMASLPDSSFFVATQNGKVIQWDTRKPAAIPQPAETTILAINGTNRTVKAMATYESISKLYIALSDGTVTVVDGKDFTTPQTTIATNVVAPSGIQVGNANAVVTDAGSTSFATISTSENVVSYKDIGSKTAANGNFISAPSFQTVETTLSKTEDNNTYPWNTVTITIRRTGNISGYGKINYLTESGTAFTKWDFLETKGELDFAPGEISKQITVQIIGDQSVEPDEYFTFRVNNPQDGYTTGPQDSTQIVILNDDHDPKGCSIGGKGPLDPTLPGLAAAALVYAWRSRRQARKHRVR